MKKILVLIISLALFVCSSAESNVANVFGAENPKDLIDKKAGIIRRLDWIYDFNGNKLNTKKWTYELGNAIDNPYGSRVYSTYREENVNVKNGLLDIKSQISFSNENTVLIESAYTGGITTTMPDDGFNIDEIEIRAKTAPGKGVCSLGFVMGKQNVWPTCGEVDLLEYSNNSKFLTQALYTKKFNGLSDNLKPIVWQSKINDSIFHTYRMKRQKNKIQLYVDDMLRGTYNPADYCKDSDPTQNRDFWPFNQLMGITLRASLSPSLAGERNPDGWTLVKTNEDSKDYETHTYIDYVKTYVYVKSTLIESIRFAVPFLDKAYKKKKSKKLIVKTLRDIQIDGFNFRVYKTKKTAKKNKKVLYKQSVKGRVGKAILKSKKLKNKKKLYVRARYYRSLYGVKYNSKWGSPIKVKIKK